MFSGFTTGLLFDGAIGIDIGSSKCSISVYQQYGIQVISTIPAYISFTTQGIHIGEEARANSEQNSQNRVFDLLRLYTKKYSELDVDRSYWPFTISYEEGVGTLVVITINGITKRFTPAELLGHLVKKCKAIAEEFLQKKVTKAVITCPTTFSIAQRLHFSDDVTIIADLTVLRVLHSGISSSIEYLLSKEQENEEPQEETLLIFDMGSSFLNLCILRYRDPDIVEIVATGGTYLFGGQDFTNRLNDVIKSQILDKKKTLLDSHSPKLRSVCEATKKILSQYPQVQIRVDSIKDGLDFNTTLTRDVFENSNQALFEESINFVGKVLNDAKLDGKDVDRVLLMGGSSCIPKIQENLKEYFDGRDLITTMSDNVESSAYGAAYIGAMLTGKLGSDKNLLALDCVPYSIGILTADESIEVIIEKGTKIPIRKTTLFTTNTHNQNSMLFQVFEVHGQNSGDWTFLCSFTISNLPKEPRGVPQVDIKIELDVNSKILCSSRQGNHDFQYHELSTKQSFEYTESLVVPVRTTSTKSSRTSSRTHSSDNIEDLDNF